MTKTAVSRSGRTAFAGLAVLLCAGLAACGTVRAGEAAGPAAPVAAPGPERCDLDGTTGTDAGAAGATVAPDIPTEEQTGGYAGPPTDEETGGYAGPPTDQDTGAPDPPTDGTSGPGAATNGAATNGAATNGAATNGAATNGAATNGAATNGAATNGAGPCGAAGWFDMRRDFVAYYAKHRTEEDTFVSADGISEVRVRKVRGKGLAEVTFTTRAVGKGRGDDARRVVRVFAAWRHEVYGGTDAGTVTVRTREEFPVTVTEPW
ncbi:hypothetical protein [Streptomyces sp. NBC_00347]|uniref:hypothetical protein n=1 Tax=Streptomyces sp. NBC_00347 TaxID=2975721 RepID=UPI00225256D4|nr:hypothetical protein [Streptomyces sp. NBC_00347]MCX5128350.1 hypothetical protein [Streptomyces sp. NBC_00347]